MKISLIFVAFLENMNLLIKIIFKIAGKTIAVGNKEDLVSFIDVRTHKIIAEEQFKFEVNEISWNKESNLFFLTNGQGCIHVHTYPEMELVHGE